MLFHVPFKFAMNRNKLLKTTGWGFAGIVFELIFGNSENWMQFFAIVKNEFGDFFKSRLCGPKTS